MAEVDTSVPKRELYEIAFKYSKHPTRKVLAGSLTITATVPDFRTRTVNARLNAKFVVYSTIVLTFASLIAVRRNANAW